MRLAEFLCASASDTGKRLYASYRRVRKTATERWVPTLPPHDQSHAGLPHTRNVQREIDKLLAPVLVRPDAERAGITAAEAYVLLTATQLHDIGRLFARKRHGQESRQVIARCGIELGLIPNEHLVQAVADVCGCHDMDPEDCASRLEQLRTRHAALEGFGVVRVASLAALLAVADEMDESYLRSVPRFVGEERGEGARKGREKKRNLCAPQLQRGEIRRRVTSTETDAIGCCIVCCVLDPDGELKKALRRPELADKQQRRRIRSALRPLIDKDKRILALDSLLGCWENRSVPKGVAHLKRNPVFRRELIPRRIGGTLAVAWRLLDDLKEKDEKLKAVREHLLPLGVDYREWFIEVEGVLWDSEARQRCEPGLDPIAADSICEAMEVLSHRVFGRREFSYAELAAQARVADVRIVERTVRRVALWENEEKNDSCAVVLGPESWSLVEGSPVRVARRMLR